MMQYKYQTPQTQSKEKSQMMKMKIAYNLLSLCVNKGIDFIAKCFTKINLTKIKFFYVCDYSLNRFDHSHPNRDLIIQELENVVQILNGSQFKCSTKQNIMTNALVRICYYLDIPISLDSHYDSTAQNIFPKIQSISFNNKWFECNDFYQKLHIEDKLSSMFQTHTLQKYVHLIRMTSHSTETNSLIHFADNIYFDVITKEMIHQSSYVEELVDDQVINNINNNEVIHETFIENEETQFIPQEDMTQYVFPYYIDNIPYTIQLINSSYCLIYDSNGNSTYLEYGVNEDGYFYIL